MSDIPDTVEALGPAIEAERRRFLALRDVLEAELGAVYRDALDATDTLLSLADEFGQEHAMQLLAERPGDFGELRGARLEDDARSGLGERLSTLLDAHESLDDLTDRRARLDSGREPDGTRVINIQGHAFTFDAKNRELRSVDRPEERLPLEIEVSERDSPSLTEQVRQIGGIDRAEPQTHDRERNRTR